MSEEGQLAVVIAPETAAEASRHFAALLAAGYLPVMDYGLPDKPLGNFPVLAPLAEAAEAGDLVVEPGAAQRPPERRLIRRHHGPVDDRFQILDDVDRADVRAGQEIGVGVRAAQFHRRVEPQLARHRAIFVGIAQANRAIRDDVETSLAQERQFFRVLAGRRFRCEHQPARLQRGEGRRQRRGGADGLDPRRLFHRGHQFLFGFNAARHRCARALQHDHRAF